MDQSPLFSQTAIPPQHFPPLLASHLHEKSSMSLTSQMHELEAFVPKSATHYATNRPHRTAVFVMSQKNRPTGCQHPFTMCAPHLDVTSLFPLLPLFLFYPSSPSTPLPFYPSSSSTPLPLLPPFLPLAPLVIRFTSISGKVASPVRRRIVSLIPFASCPPPPPPFPSSSSFYQSFTADHSTSFLERGAFWLCAAREAALT